MYFELAEAALQVEVAATSVRDRETIAKLVHGRFQRGLTRGLDVRLTLTDVANARAELARAENQREIAARRLEVLLGRYPTGAARAPRVLAALPKAVPAGLPVMLLTAGRTSRPRWRGLKPRIGGWRAPRRRSCRA